MVGVSINLKPDLLAQIDEAKDTSSRSGFIVKAVYEYLNPIKSEWEADKIQLLTQIEAGKNNERRLENEVEYLRQEYSKINDALAQRLLSEPKKSFWDRFRSKK